MSETVIKVDGVSKDFSYSRRKAVTVKSAFTSMFSQKEQKEKATQHALKNINFEIQKGEFFGIVGRNGSGKSTLLKILAGIYQPNKGKVHVTGKLVPFIELGVGFNPELTGRENVYLNGALLGFSEQEVKGFYDEVVDFAELEKFMDKKLKNYSSGMQVRLAFSMAVRAEADVLLIDEVLAVGDADFQRKCFNYFKQLKRSKTTVVFVTHDMNAVRQFCDRAMLVNDGSVAAIGDVDDIAFAYTKLFAQENNAGIHKGTNKSRILHDIKVETDRNITINGLMTATEKLDDPVFGFIIKDAAGIPVVGFNTQMITKRLGTLGTNQTKSFSWRFPNVLSDGDYTIDLALVGEDGVTIIDWWNEALNLTIKKTVVSPYPITPEVSLTVKEIT